MALEEEIFDPQKIKNFLRSAKWYRTVSKDKTISLGGRVYYLPKAAPKTEMEIRFNPHKTTFLFFDANGKLVNSKPAQGLSFNELAGDLETFIIFLQSVEGLIT